MLKDGTTYGVYSPTLAYPVVEALTAAAHKADLLVIAHAVGQEFARWAIRAGVDVLAHTVVDDPPADDVITGLAHTGMSVISTLTVFEAAEDHQLWKDRRVSSWADPAFLERLSEHVPSTHRSKTQVAFGRDAIRAYHQAGVPVLAGTDAPNPGTRSGASLHRQLQLLLRAGFSTDEALAAATSRPAPQFGFHDRGRIAPGLLPDLVLVQGAVEEDFATTWTSDTFGSEVVFAIGQEAWNRIGAVERACSSNTIRISMPCADELVEGTRWIYRLRIALARCRRACRFTSYPQP